MRREAEEDEETGTPGGVRSPRALIGTISGHHVEVERVHDHLVELKRGYDRSVTSLTLRAKF